MSPLDALAVLAAGVAAGAVNAIVGSGSLITFPVLLAVGYAPVVANVSNTCGLVLGNLSAAWGYRRELAGQRRRALRLGAPMALGSVVGGTLLLVLPGAVFGDVVPALILLACVLMATRPSPTLTDGISAAARTATIVAICFFAGIYGGYFGAAAGVILLASLRLLIADGLQRLNGLKNLLVGVANAVAAIQFAIFAHVAWDAAALIAAGSVVGAQLGASYGRRLPEATLRWTVVTVGAAVALVLFLK